MTPHHTFECIPLREALTAEECARRHLRCVGVFPSPAHLPCGTCRVGASTTTALVDAGWRPEPRRDAAA